MNKRESYANILFFEDDDGAKWEFAFIYYNNRKFGGTRNEYRLTRMTKYLRSASLVSGDEVVFERHTDNYKVSYRRKGGVAQSSGVLTLTSGWKVIEL